MQNIHISPQVHWHRSLDEVPTDVPAIVIAHEFFDALPVHQFQVGPWTLSLKGVWVVGYRVLPCTSSRWAPGP